MLKFAMIAGVAMIAAPVLAQTTTGPVQGSPSGTAAVPSSTPGDGSVSGQQGTPTDAVPMQSAAREQPATGSQVAQVVDTEFPTYDKNGDGKLSATEFGGWMVALKSKTDPTTKPDAPETKKWVSTAFAQADTDKNKSLTKTELTSFLSQG
ncbi:EF-hand domain-containing protein [Sphingomonas sp. CFBP 13603]|uniref:EF-hand domain-containing protein n=1 Tax=Sphingomonas sp. CFBP 13603 TaxID=2774040 RepID=UPI001869565F|nr:EF-hand domain-containing protein [Sphingomonas sp. CFBP 13603]MBE2993356.1 EF-hand domain-containing protein [Sphingomonas sp. CFBP 13603]